MGENDISHSDTVVSATEPRAADHGALRGTTSYQLGEVIGRGGMGEVVLAHDPTIGRDVALKRLRGDAPSSELVERFLREAKIQARLDHPAICPVHELGHDSEGRPYFTMKRVTGTTMTALLDGGSATLQRLLRALVDVCLAVELAHTRGVVHRDLKPSNIMLGDYGEVYVLDWGVARVLAESDGRAMTDVESLDGETKVGSLLGTPGYMAPEQARGEPVSTSADLYALGAILFEILAGQTLHPRGVGALASTLDGVDPSPSRRAPDHNIAPELDAACIAALATEPRTRPTARSLANMIQAYLDGDRDHERRVLHAAELVTEARTAIATGEQAKALNAAGRAVAFDPSSSDASGLILELLVDTKRPPPPELAAELDEDEAQEMKLRSRRALGPYASLFMLAPLVPWLHIRSWPTLVVLYASISFGIFMVWLNTQRRVSVALTLGAHLLVAVLFTRMAGPFLITPVFICAILLSATTLPSLIDRPLTVLSWTLLAAAAPLILEGLGVIAPSWSLGTEGLASFGTIFEIGHTFDKVVLVIGNITAVLVVGWFARSIGRDRRDAQRLVTVQLWRFHQLLPRAKRTAAGA
jgi:eukaryotic-like serine/threonine-protein kinase